MEQNNLVAVKRYDETTNALRESIELSKGFEKLKKTDRVLIKPNIIWGGGLIKGVPKYGFVVTSRIIEDIIILLREYGCDNITIGEGSVVSKELNSNTMNGYKWTGIAKVAKKYNVKLIDLNKRGFEQVDMAGTPVNVAKDITETDFLINVPVMKTHYLVGVSLGMKNLKGCIDLKSRKSFHKLDLNRFIALLNTHIKPDLTIIDGIYALENGPTPTGTAHRMNAIVTGQDTFSCDIVGTTLMGISPTFVPYLKEFASMTNRSLDINTIDVKGENIESLTKKMGWKSELTNIFRKANIEGVTFQSPGDTICTGCATSLESFIILFCNDNKGVKLDGVEICVSSSVKANKNSKTVFLVGDCAIEKNKDLENAIKIKGCPPSLINFLVTFIKNTLEPNKARTVILKRVLKGIGTKLGIYNENLNQTNYEPPAFNENHF